MSQARERFRQVLSQPTCTVAANIFDPLSARIAHMLDSDVCFLSGSVGKVAVAARTDPTTVIVARTAALTYGPLDEALDRIRAYAQAGVEAIRLVGLRTRE
jgi:2-methylisocitrate lyase-like PEP mutase family enzyme